MNSVPYDGFTLRKQLRFYITKASKDDIFTQAAALAYFAVLALAPLIIILMSFLSLLSFDLQEQLKIQTTNLIGIEARQVLESILNSAGRRPDLSVIAGWVGFVLLAISGSVVFAQMQSSLNIIFKTRSSRPNHSNENGFFKKFISRRLLSVLILLSFILFSIVSLIISEIFSDITGGYQGVVIDIFSGLVNITVYTIFFSMIYKWIPDRFIQTSESLLAGLLTAAMFVLGKSLIAVYIEQTAMSSAYGAAGSLVVLLTWIYYSALVFFLGAEFLATFLLSNSSH